MKKQELEIGDHVRVRGQRGTFVVTGFNSDGSIGVYGGATGYGSFRDFRPNLVSLTKAPTKRS
jgi:hypothetical protein